MHVPSPFMKSGLPPFVINQAAHHVAHMQVMGQVTRTRIFGPPPAQALMPALATVTDYKELYETLLAAQQQEATPEEIAEAINRSAPKFEALSRWVLTPQGAALATWLTVVIAILAFILSKSGTTVTNNYNNIRQITNNGPTLQEIEQYIANAVRCAEERTRHCWCGCGETYERCHGR